MLKIAIQFLIVIITFNIFYVFLKCKENRYNRYMLFVLKLHDVLVLFYFRSEYIPDFFYKRNLLIYRTNLRKVYALEQFLGKCIKMIIGQTFFKWFQI